MTENTGLTEQRVREIVRDERDASVRAALRETVEIETNRPRPWENQRKA